MMAASPGLIDHSLPQGFHYRENFITEAEERVLLDAIGHVAFSDFEMRGVVARRRVAFFGQLYDRGAAGPLPAFLLPLRATVAQWASVDADAFAMALINEYRPGSPIGWHPLRSTTSSPVFRCCRHADETPSIPVSCVPNAAAASSIGDTRNCARAAIGVSHDRRVSNCI